MASRDSLFLLSISFSFLLSSTDQTSRDVVDDCTIDVPAKTADAGPQQYNEVIPIACNSMLTEIKGKEKHNLVYNLPSFCI